MIFTEIFDMDYKVKLEIKTEIEEATMNNNTDRIADLLDRAIKNNMYVRTGPTKTLSREELDNILHEEHKKENIDEYRIGKNIMVEQCIIRK